MNLYFLIISFFVNFSFLSSTNLDFARPWQLGFQDAASPIMEGIISFHHDVMFIMTIIMIFVFWMLMRILYLFHASRNPNPQTFTNHTVLEIVWTVIPSFILVIIAVPSFALLYAMDEVVDPAMTIKVNGHQWYWSYEYSTDLTVDGEQLIDADETFLFDSYLKDESDLEIGELRLLEVDNRLVLPIQKHIRVIVTAADVLHCWAVPALGIKMDACPGRLNQVALFIPRPGLYYGNCSEICGSRHGFMPICVEAVPFEDYCNWLCNKYFD